MKEKNKQRSYSIRRFIGDIHLWLGIASGIVLFIVCLTGTIFTFRDEIVQGLNPDVFKVKHQQAQRPMPAALLIDKFTREKKVSFNAITIPYDKNSAWTFDLVPPANRADDKVQAGRQAESGRKNAKAGGHGRERGARGGGPRSQMKYFVDPYQGKILGTSQLGSVNFFWVIMDLHRSLLIRGAGQLIVGISTLIFIILEISGLILWAPAKWKQMKKWKMWKQGFIIKSSGLKRLNYDLHNTLGFYSFLLVTVMALTGLCWSFDWYREGASRMLGGKIFGGRNEKFAGSKIDASARKLSADDLILISETQLPYQGDIRLLLPASDTASAVVYKTKVGFFAGAGIDKLVIDQYSGRVILIDRFRDKTLGKKISESIRPLHFGSLFGTFTKILYFIACLIATSLPVTGTIIWIGKLRKRSGKKVKADHKRLTLVTEPIV